MRDGIAATSRAANLPWPKARARGGGLAADEAEGRDRLRPVAAVAARVIALQAVRATPMDT